MNRFRNLGVVLFISLLVSSAYSQERSLAGDWQFRLDPENKGLSDRWFDKELPDTIVLPGSCEERGFGVKATVKETDRLTRAIRYEGKAWYQRSIDVPAAWHDKRLELFLERCHWESSVWLDGKPYGVQQSLSAPHVYDFGVVAPGTHTVTICIDNNYKIPIGKWGFAITDDTQGNWNGIIGQIQLRATDPVWIDNVQVYADHLQVKIGNGTGRPQQATIRQQEVVIPRAGTVLHLPFQAAIPGWDEFAPVTGSLTLTLAAGKYLDKKTISYGVRELVTKNGQFINNGRPVLMRGPVNECIYPLTGYPPMDKASWVHVLTICKAYGFNFMRFNSWCPPEAAFQAADELGFYLQVELPFWSIDAPVFGEDPLRDQFLADELYRILETYGNHPSFTFMALGNESPGPMDVLVNKGRKVDGRRLYRCADGDTITRGDYAERGTEIGQRGVAGPRTNWDRWTLTTDSLTNTYRLSHLPTMAHEVGQWASYPDFDQIAKFTGNLKPHNYERFRNSLAAQKLSDQNKAFARASGMFAVSLYKDEIEGCLRTWPHGGFQVVEARDFPGEGGAMIGWLDAFWDSKGLITPEAFRRFCAPTVCLIRMARRVLTNQEVFTADVEVAHYGPLPIASAFAWKIENEKGRLLFSGSLPAIPVACGQVTAIGRIRQSLQEVQFASRLVATVSGGGTSNSWNIWVYPATQTGVNNKVTVSYAYDSATRLALNRGERVLLFSSPKEGLFEIKNEFLPPDGSRLFPSVSRGKSAIPGSFLPAFWNMRLFNQIGTLGILCDPRHVALKHFPTQPHSDWQWADILGRFTALTSYRIAGDERQHDWGDVFDRSKAIILNETPPDYRPIVQVIDNYERNYKLGLIFETRVGKGKLLICAADLDTDADKRPAARQLKASLLEYAAGKSFKPAHELAPAFLEKILSY